MKRKQLHMFVVAVPATFLVLYCVASVRSAGDATAEAQDTAEQKAYEIEELEQRVNDLEWDVERLN